jgi:CRISPR system Cascade subunit CasC
VHICCHIVQTLPFSNANRDDLGQPKSAFYGGVDRGRISSQSSKRIVRHRFEKRMGDLAIRTRRLPGAVATELQRRGWALSEASAAGQAVIKAADIKGLTVEGDATNTLLFVPQAAIGRLADLAARDQAALLAAAKKPKSAPEVVADITAILTSTNPSIALFGRMLADSQAARVDGALAVAHPTTTHATASQPDFFTAVDDLPGAQASAMMGDAAHNAGVWYRYASLDTDELLRGLSGDLDLARKATRLVLEEIAGYTPEAKKNSTAPHTPPTLVYLTVRDDRPVSLAGAFERPVRAINGSGWLAPTITALVQHAQAVDAFWGGPGACVLTGVGLTQDAAQLGTPVPSLVRAVEQITSAAYPAPEVTGE